MHDILVALDYIHNAPENRTEYIQVAFHLRADDFLHDGPSFAGVCGGEPQEAEQILPILPRHIAVE